jgi:4-aminobutyrate aminotransferase-like enzyme
MLASAAWSPDLICLGKGLAGGLPLSACVGSAEVMGAWSRDAEVVHTQTFAGAPLACATALATLDVLARERLAARALSVGERFAAGLRTALSEFGGEISGQGLMIGVHVPGIEGGASRVQRALLERGYITSSGGGARQVLVLTPPLTIAEELLDGFVRELCAVLTSLS